METSVTPSPRNFDEHSFWTASETTSGDESGATRLRRDSNFVEKVISTLEVISNLF
jgi:hypothetical protein